MKIDILYREKKIPNFIFQYLFIHLLLLFLALLFTTGAIHAQNYHVEASSEHPGEGFAKHAVDGNLKTYWHMRYGKNRPSQPHYIILDLGRSRRLLGFVYVPRLMGSNGRIGGEGTGGQSFFTHQWSLNKTYRFMIKSRVRGSKTDFSGYFYLNEQNKWKHLVTFRVETGGQNLSGYYSFVEDFRRDFKSYTEKRSAFWSNGYVQSKSASWKAITRARFTGDNLKPVNINAGIKNNRFFLETGGATINKTRLNSTLQIRPSLNRIFDDLP